MTGATRRNLWLAALVATVAFAALFPYRVTDGDSCAYGSLGVEIARGGPGAWVAPTWDFFGVESAFHEHPPASFWPTAVLSVMGIPDATAPLAASALWHFAAVAGVIALARRVVGSGAADFAGLAFLLHAAVMRSVQRVDLEVPLAACSAWCVVGALRLREGRGWIGVAAAGLAGAFLVRGVFGVVPAAALAFVAVRPPLRPPLVRLALAVVVAAAALLVFDRLHALQTGRGFWAQYWERQVAPSFVAGGSDHSVEGSTWAYYVGRAALYTLPWSLLPVARLVRGPRPLPAPAAWGLAAAWIVVAVAGPSLTSREGSRYVFLVFVATSLLAGLAVGPDLGPRLAAWATVLVAVAIPVQVVVKSVFHERDDWWRTADLLQEARAREDFASVPVPVHGEFQPVDERLKSFLRFHLGARITSADAADARRIWFRAGVPVPAGWTERLRTPLGVLADRR
jgi:4-amino-4-deoxy-L-arabinose transferase-like glycosyltransferase